MTRRGHAALNSATAAMTSKEPPPLSVEDPRAWCTTLYPGGATPSFTASGASDAIQVPVSARTSSCMSAMTSWMWAAVRVADLLLRTAMFNYDLGPGLRSMPADSSSSRTTAPDRQRGGRSRYTDPRNSNRRSTALSNDDAYTLIDASQH